MAPTWLDVAREFAAEHGVEERYVVALSALRGPLPRGGPPPPPERPWPGDFDELRRAFPIDRAALLGLLGAEVDSDQAEMFVRRVRAVHRTLGELSSPASELLCVGLRVRLAGICDAPGPRALRVRALADFYYSLAGRLGAPGGPPPGELLKRLDWRRVASGVDHVRVEGPTNEGPIHVNLLRLEPDRVRLQVVDCRGSSLPFVELVRQRGAVAATSGGFFLYSEPDIEPPSQRFDPVGLLVSDGRVRNPAWLRRGALLAAPGRVELRPVGTPGAITRARGAEGPDVDSVALVGTAVVARGRRLAVPLNGAVFAGDPPPIEAPRLADGRLAEQAIAGGPMLVVDGQVDIDLQAEDFWGTAPPQTFSQDETGDQNLLPRLAAGLDDRGRLLLAAVDGRNFERALGLTLSGTAQLMRTLGCHTALNLDGGSSKRMVVEGRAVDLASTEVVGGEADPARVRPVHTGLLVYACL